MSDKQEDGSSQDAAVACVSAAPPRSEVLEAAIERLSKATQQRIAAVRYDATRGGIAEREQLFARGMEVAQLPYVLARDVAAVLEELQRLSASPAQSSGPEPAMTDIKGWPNGPHPTGEPPEVTQYPDGSWVVEQVDQDGGVCQTIFIGPHSEWRARNYAREVKPHDQ